MRTWSNSPPGLSCIWFWASPARHLRHYFRFSPLVETFGRGQTVSVESLWGSSTPPFLERGRVAPPPLQKAESAEEFLGDQQSGYALKSGPVVTVFYTDVSPPHRGVAVSALPSGGPKYGEAILCRGRTFRLPPNSSFIPRQHSLDYRHEHERGKNTTVPGMSLICWSNIIYRAIKTLCHSKLMCFTCLFG